MRTSEQIALNSKGPNKYDGWHEQMSVAMWNADAQQRLVGEVLRLSKTTDAVGVRIQAFEEVPFFSVLAKCFVDLVLAVSFCVPDPDPDHLCSRQMLILAEFKPSRRFDPFTQTLKHLQTVRECYRHRCPDADHDRVWIGLVMAYRPARVEIERLAANGFFWFYEPLTFCANACRLDDGLVSVAGRPGVLPLTA